ncbi:sulfate/thiosulfate import ATP-binding protein cysA [Paraglaciecola mesophila KMM 241]|uniref:Sulfate/thiosulfate import ATP-binding protein cysA n=1 Tax=Paraglaciecola mesophila KMM 241 TaxID=1128912 RepID=K6Z824_9ALTE|nr:ATP-binding cassette domain-containing protein [Paraglaciecola mesophila]GAC25143.1 sulfate/thiosulfate import ATP-binding protein cysA [Paraglaciecola mesophila KMM 241]
MLRINNCQINTVSGQISLPDITLEQGELLVLTGPSGMGKSTFLHWVLGDEIEHASISGDIILNEKPLNDLNVEQRGIGLLMQDVHLFPHLNVLDNICFALPALSKNQQGKKQNKQQRRETATNMLEKIELGYVAGHFANQLSGGERSRVGLVRALANQPQALLMDEPFAALDPNTSAKVSQWAFEQLQQQGVPSIMVSHDIDNIPAHAQHIDLGAYFHSTSSASHAKRN